MEEESGAHGKGRDAIAAEDGGAWKAISAGMIADCVALCCCPCAVVNLLTLALVKAPWKLGRRCLGLGKKKRKREKIGGGCVLVERTRARKAVAGGAMLEFPGEFGGGEPESERCEAEKVWFELYQFGHLGFGRVSFTGTQPLQGRGNLGINI